VEPAINEQIGRGLVGSPGHYDIEVIGQAVALEEPGEVDYDWLRHLLLQTPQGLNQDLTALTENTSYGIAFAVDVNAVMGHVTADTLLHIRTNSFSAKRRQA
jgi:hypothetical protein